MLNRERSINLSGLKALITLPVVMILVNLLYVPTSAFELPLQNVDSIQFNLPLQKGRISLGFGKANNPFTHTIAFHEGIDIAAKQGTNIYAVYEGKVLVADSVAVYGNRIILQHAQGYTTHYYHLYKNRVTEANYVKTGDVIGWVGSSGRSTGPHLHFELRKNGTALNPAEFLDFYNHY